MTSPSEHPPVDVRYDLPGWTLLWADLEWSGDRVAVAAPLAELRREAAEQARKRWTLATLSSDPVVAAMRKLFREAGTDPTRYRPSSEALIRRLLKGDEIPEIHPLVDLNNVLSATLAVPCCVMRAGSTEGPYVLRAGREGESYESLRGPFNLEGKPLLVDARGPCDTPITGNVRVKVEEGTRRGWFVGYMPREALSMDKARRSLSKILYQLQSISLPRP